MSLDPAINCGTQAHARQVPEDLPLLLVVEGDLEQHSPELAAQPRRHSRQPAPLLYSLPGLQRDAHRAMQPGQLALRDRIRNAIAVEEYGPKKAVISAFVQDVEVRSCAEIYPTFRVPTAAGIDEKVRMLTGSVGPAGLEPATGGL